MVFHIWVLIFTQFAISGLKAVTLEQSFVQSTKKDEPAHFWSHKNGNLHRNGVSPYSAPTNLSQPLWEWTVPGSNILQGHIESTPLIDRHGTVILADTIGGIYALTRNGTELWKHLETKDNRILTGALYGNSLLVHTSRGIALALDLTTGNVNWRRQYAKMAGGDAHTMTAAKGLAILAGATEAQGYAGGNNVIYALDASTGNERWNFTLPGVMFYNFMPAVSDDKLLFIDSHGAMYCLDLGSGNLLWQAPGGEGFTTAGVTLGDHGLAYTNFNTDGSEGGILKAYDINTGAERWSQYLGLEASAAPAVGSLGQGTTDGVVVGLGHNVGFWHPNLEDAKAELRAFDAVSGKPLWTTETPSQMLHGSAGLFSVPGEDSVPDTWSTPAIGSDGTIYVAWEGGKHFAIQGATGKIISEHFTGYGCQGEPAIADGFVVVPTIGRVVAYSV